MSDGAAHADEITVFQLDFGIRALRALLGCFAGLTTAIALAVDVGAVEAAEIAQDGVGRAGFEEEVDGGRCGRRP